jgi:hypothetical protein
MAIVQIPITRPLSEGAVRTCTSVFASAMNQIESSPASASPAKASAASSEREPGQHNVGTGEKGQQPNTATGRPRAAAGGEQRAPDRADPEDREHRAEAARAEVEDPGREQRQRHGGVEDHPGGDRHQHRCPDRRRPPHVAQTDSNMAALGAR